MATENRASMVAYYSILIPDARLPLMRARVVDQKLKVIEGDQSLDDSPIALKGFMLLICRQTVLEFTGMKKLISGLHS